MSDRPASADFSLLATAVASRPLVVIDGDRDRTWTDGVVIHLRRGCANPYAEVLVQAALVRSGALDAAMRLPRGRLKLRRRFTALEASRAVGLLPPTLQRHTTNVPPARSSSSAESLAIARGGTAVQDPIEVGEIRLRALAATRARATDATSGGDVDPRAPSDSPNQNVERESTELPRFLNARRSAVTLRRRRSSSLERAQGTASVLGDFASAGAAGQPPLNAADEVALESLPDGRLSDGRWFPEWDQRRRSYRARWCQVVVVSPDQLSAHVPLPDDVAMRRALVRLHDGYRNQRRQPGGADFDLDAVIEHLVKRAAGSSGSGDLFVDQRHRRRDLTAQVCLDVSGSAADPSPSGATVHHHQVTAAHLIVSAFEVLGHRTALHGFRSNGRTDVQMLAVKSFDERLDGAARSRLHALAPAGRTRLGAAIRWGRRELALDRSASHRLLLVLSDGFAYDHDYEGLGARLDTRRALLEARASGTACLCVSVGAPDDHRELEAVFGSTAFLRADGADHLVAELRPAIERAFALAAVQSGEIQGAHRSA